MPEHVHLLVSEPDRGTLAVALQMLKQVSAHELRQFTQGKAFWLARYYDFNVWTERKRIEKLRLHTSQSGCSRVGGQSRRLGMEQL